MTQKFQSPDHLPPHIDSGKHRRVSEYLALGSFAAQSMPGLLPALDPHTSVRIEDGGVEQKNKIDAVHSFLTEYQKGAVEAAASQENNQSEDSVQLGPN